MAQADLLLAIDQGTTSSRAIVFDRDSAVVAQAQKELDQIYPQPGWVEHDPKAIWADTVAVVRDALEHVRDGAARIAAVGITNQRETALLWERASGRPIMNAIVWQDRRTADACHAVVADGNAAAVADRTGLVVDPYFSATKVAWMLDHVEGARARAERRELAFGTVDSFLLWRLTGGRVHATDATNASCTMLFDIHRQDWDDDLLDLFRVPRAVLPEVRDSAADFGATEAALFGRPLTIAAMAGDQHAATVGQACFEPGMIKGTYGTGAFLVLNTGSRAVASSSRLLTTVAYRLDGQVTYALEGSIFVAGAGVQWLRDGLGVIDGAVDTEAIAAAIDGTGGVYLVPAFTGLGAPYWDAGARGVIVGLTRDTGVPELVRATLESTCYQTLDLMWAMAADGAHPGSLRVDGGMVVNGWLMQMLADVIDLSVERPFVMETTALGVAYLAGLQVGIYGSLDEVARGWHRERLFEPTMDDDARAPLVAGWADAVRRARSEPGGA